MPIARGNQGHLRDAVRFFLVHGRLPPHGAHERDGMVEAFTLRHTHLGRAEYLSQLRSIWLEHSAEIVEAAAGAEPWVVTVLRDPSHLDADEITTDDDEGGEHDEEDR